MDAEAVGEKIGRAIAFGWWIAAAVIVVSWLFDIPDDFRGQVTVYPLAHHEDGRWVPLDRAIYRAFPEAQMVVVWNAGSDESPAKFTDCIVATRKRWRCSFDDQSGFFQMANGKFSNTRPLPSGVPYTAVKFVSEWRWRLALAGTYLP